MLLQLHKDHLDQMAQLSENVFETTESRKRSEKLQALYSQKEQTLRINIEELHADENAGREFVRKLTGTTDPDGVIKKANFEECMQKYIRFIFTSNALAL